MVNAPTSFKNLKARVHDLHAGKLKSVPIDLKNSVMLYWRKLLKHKIQHTKDKSKSFRKKVLDATTLIQFNQYNRDKQNSEKKVLNVTRISEV